MKNRFLKFLNDLLFPEDIKCIFCGCDIPNFEQKPCCDDCQKQLPFNDGNRCLICDEPILNDAHVCDFCQRHKRNFKRAICPFVYDGLVRKVVLNYKELNQRYLAKSFAKFIADRILKDNISVNVITFIPMTIKKEKNRSFNQSKLLATELGKILNLPVVEMFKKERDVKSQKSSTYKERQKNMFGTYTLQPIKHKKTDKVLIVDDVITTCATVNYCAGLIKNKVQSVYVTAIARNKLKREKILFF